MKPKQIPWENYHQDEQNKNWRAFAAVAILPVACWMIGMLCDQFTPTRGESRWLLGRTLAVTAMLLCGRFLVPIQTFNLPFSALDVLHWGHFITLTAACVAAIAEAFGFRWYCDALFFAAHAGVVAIAAASVSNLAPAWIKEHTLPRPQRSWQTVLAPAPTQEVVPTPRLWPPVPPPRLVLKPAESTTVIVPPSPPEPDPEIERLEKEYEALVEEIKSSGREPMLVKEQIGYLKQMYQQKMKEIRR